MWYLALTFIWGSSYLLIKLGLGSLSAVQVASLRIVCGVAVLLALLALTRGRLPRGLRTWGHLLVTGTLLCTLPWTLFAVGEERVTSAVAGISNATTPVVAVLGEVGVQTLPGRRYACGHFNGTALEIHAAWQRMFTEWLPDMALAPDYFGIFIPAGVPPEVVATVDKIWAEKVTTSEALKTYAETFGAVFAPSYGEEARALAMPVVILEACSSVERGESVKDPIEIGIDCETRTEVGTD